MKYLLTSIRQNNTNLKLENVVPAKTGHIKGYGAGVTLTSRGASWNQNATFTTTRNLAYSEPTVIPQ